jgi:hypothetical protein
MNGMKIKILIVVCVAHPEGEQVVLETGRGC